MNKTKIEWCDMTWNPVAGCLHNCPYCYARRIANRFGGASETHYNECVGEECQWCTEETGKTHDLTEPIYDVDRGHNAPYPFGFDPTFFRYRLDEPARKTKGQKIFVCSMADLFGDWVPDEWIREVFRACEAAPQHKYLFLTKNPKGIRYPFHQYFNNKNWWIGTSVTSNADHQRAWDLLQETTRKTNKFLSIEPLHGEFDLVKYELLCKGYPQKITIGDYYNWVIVGAETGNRKGKVVPEKVWIDEIVNQCHEVGVPVFMKDSLKGLMGDDFVQEWPENMRKEITK